MLRLPNINPVTEMVDMMTATRAYQANIAVLTSFREMMLQTLRLGRSRALAARGPRGRGR